MSIRADKTRLSQAHNITRMRHVHKSNDLVTVYQVDEKEHSKQYIYCALIPSSQIHDSLSKSDWDLRYYRGIPGWMTYHEDGELHCNYLRYGNDSGVEPLIINRTFYGLREEYSEISEEFRLFHKLFHDRKTNKYFKISDDGNEELVALVKPNCIQIRLKEIRQYLAIKEMHLAIQFVFHENSIYTLEELGLRAEDKHLQDELLCCLYRSGDLSGFGECRAFSRLVGKCLIEPISKDNCDFPFYVYDYQYDAPNNHLTSTEDIFLQRYCTLQKVSEKQLGTQWLLPLNEVDKYYIDCLKEMELDEQIDFDALVTMILCLSKVMSESLNEVYLKKMIPCEKQEEYKEMKGVDLLEAVMQLNEIKEVDEHIDFLRKLQDLHSSSIAYRKGGNYQKLAKQFGIEDKNLIDLFAEVHNSADNVLVFFIILINSGRIREIVEKNQMAAGYAVMGEMIGLIDDGPTDSSVNHDAIIYETESKT